jgi:hypothetical protein
LSAFPPTHHAPLPLVLGLIPTESSFASRLNGVLQQIPPKSGHWALQNKCPLWGQ